MSETTGIEWTDATWQPITGCSVLSPGCKNCYAMRLAGTRLQHHPSRAGLTQPSAAGPVWNGKVRFNEQWLRQPLQWSRPRMIFVCAHGDLFHEHVPLDWVDSVFAVMALARQHTFQVLTKRSRIMRDYLCDDRRHDWARRAVQYFGGNDPDAVYDSIADAPRVLPNVWIGVSVERQLEADERREELRAVAAAGWTTWCSYEPALGSVDWRGWEFAKWIVSGGESGPRARPAHPDWFGATRDFCESRGIAYLHKQNGEFASVSEVEGAGAHYYFPDGATVRRVGKRAAGRLLDGVLHDGYPARDAAMREQGGT